jgi:hypothetical protein
VNRFHSPVKEFHRSWRAGSSGLLDEGSAELWRAHRVMAR